MPAFTDIEEETDAAAGRGCVRILDDHNLLADSFGFVDDRGCLTLSVTLKGYNCQRAACGVLHEKTDGRFNPFFAITSVASINEEGT